MRIEQHLKLRWQRLLWHLKSTGVLFWVPLAVMDVLIPLLVVSAYLKRGITEGLHLSVVQYTQMLLPFFSAWWPMFVLREYLEADGSELLYVCKSRRKLPDCWAIFLLYLVNLSVLYLLLGIFLFPDMGLEWLRMLCSCLFYFGLMYALIFSTQSLTVTLMALLLYTLANVVLSRARLVFPFYYTQEPASGEMLLKNALPLALTGVVGLALGDLCNRRKLKFH